MGSNRVKLSLGSQGFAIFYSHFWMIDIKYKIDLTPFWNETWVDFSCRLKANQSGVGKKFLIISISITVLLNLSIAIWFFMNDMGRFLIKWKKYYCQ